MPDHISRNDPCPCGSGRLYKHCCRRKDRARATPTPAATLQAGGLSSAHIDRLRAQLQRSLRNAPPEKAVEGARLLAELDDLQAVATRSQEIAAAEETLRTHHRSDYEALLVDPDALGERARRLFAEADFDILRFTPDEVEHAFDAAGYPCPDDDPDETDRKVRAAVLRLADEHYRQRAAVRLLAILPKYVAAGRYADAWLVEVSSISILEKPQESHPLLEAMLLSGLEQRANQTDSEIAELTQQLGVDRGRLAEMSPDELAQWIEAAQADPAVRMRIEAFYAAHPEAQARGEADWQRMQQDVLSLLKRDDADALYLAQEEVEPWALEAFRRLEPLAHTIAGATKRGKKAKKRQVNSPREVLFGLNREMCAAVFAPERVAQFVATLRDYCRALEEAGDRHAAVQAELAILMLGKEEVPAENPLLLGVCYYSLRGMMKAIMEAHGNRAAEGAS